MVDPIVDSPVFTRRFITSRLGARTSPPPFLGFKRGRYGYPRCIFAPVPPQSYHNDVHCLSSIAFQYCASRTWNRSHVQSSWTTSRQEAGRDSWLWLGRLQCPSRYRQELLGYAILYFFPLHPCFDQDQTRRFKSRCYNYLTKHLFQFHTAIGQYGCWDIGTSLCRWTRSFFSFCFFYLFTYANRLWICFRSGATHLKQWVLSWFLYKLNISGILDHPSSRHSTRHGATRSVSAPLDHSWHHNRAISF